MAEIGGAALEALLEEINGSVDDQELRGKVAGWINAAADAVLSERMSALRGFSPPSDLEGAALLPGDMVRRTNGRVAEVLAVGTSRVFCRGADGIEELDPSGVVRMRRSTARECLGWLAGEILRAERVTDGMLSRCEAMLEEVL